MIATIFSSVLAIFFVLPFISYLVLFPLLYQLTKNRKKTFHITIDVMTIMIILSVHFIILSIWKESYLSYIFYVFL
ncbi:hypothetical protein Q73_05065 [Bacillus coahuilensis m2-6]|nr:DUF3397 family protein [Bacillus coahuilensis]KUP08565.1 hypothetical protein Q73_05065 [Bacillus coahuilensis m2-6]